MPNITLYLDDETYLKLKQKSEQYQTFIKEHCVKLIKDNIKEGGNNEK